jgi:Rtf2 RING-finger
MGGDGGSIAGRKDLVQSKKKPEQKDKESELSFRWKHYTITQQPLQAPIVACGYGRLYSKESILECLLDRRNMPKVAQHIATLKDVKVLNLTPNPAFAIKMNGEKGESGHFRDPRESPYVCPVIGIEFSGKFKFVLLWECGCVISERALKLVPSEVCHKCQKPFNNEDIVFLNSDGETLELMKKQMQERKARVKANKNKANRSIEPPPSTMEIKKIEELKLKVSQNNEANKPVKRERSPERTKMDLETLTDPAYKKAKSQYSVAKDQRASSVYKSIFTSHDDTKTQTRAHWITYNPFYS